jgi:hypothetical protein
MKISKSFIVILFFLFSSFLISCTSLPDADENNQTLVIGEIILNAKGFLTYGSASVNGTSKRGIEITIREISSGKEYKMKSWSEGLFYSTKISEGNYMIIKYYFKNTVGNSWADVTQNNPGYIFEIENGVVNNLGLIQWNSERGKSTLSFYNSQHEQVRTDFREIYAESNWNEKEWKSVNLSR